MERKFYKVKSLHLVRKDFPKNSDYEYQEEINFQKENMTLEEKANITIKAISEYLDGDNYIDFYESRFNGKYLNDLVPEYMILEERPLGLYEILTNTLIVSDKDYYKGVGIYLRGYKKAYDKSLNQVPTIIDIDQVLIPVDLAGIGECFRDYNDLDMVNIINRFIKFRKEASQVLCHRLEQLKNNTDYSALINEINEEAGKAIVKKYSEGI